MISCLPVVTRTQPSTSPSSSVIATSPEGRTASNSESATRLILPLRVTIVQILGRLEGAARPPRR